MSRNSFDKMLADQQARMLQISDEIDAVGSLAETEGRELTENDHELIDGLSEEAKALQPKIDNLRNAIAERDRLRAQQVQVQPVDAQGMVQSTPKSMALPAVVARDRSKVFKSNEDAYAMGKWLQGLTGNVQARTYCRDRGIDFRNDMEGGTPSLGGFTVPQPLAAEIVRLVESFGVWRQNARTAVMTSNTLDVPSYLDGLTVYYPGEGVAIDKSDITFGQINLVAKKQATLSVMSTEVNEDSILNMVDLVVTDIATQMAWAEDRNAFLGDASPGFNSITGVKNALNAGAKVTLGAAGWNNLAKSDLHEAVGKVAQYPGIMPKWYMSSYAYQVAVLPLLTDLGGTDMRQFEEGGRQFLLGHEVVFTQVLPKATTALDDLLIVFGDLNLGAYSGQRRNLTIKLLNELFAVNDQIGVQSTMRLDSVTHSVGDATEAGAIVGIYNAAA